MKRCLHFLFLMLAVVQLSAQAPGYLGKRLYAKADAFYSFSRRGPSAANQGANYYGEKQISNYTWDYRYGLQCGYAVTRRTVAVLSASYLKTGLSTNAYTPAIIYPSGGYYDSHYLFYNLSGITMGLGYQWYNTAKGAIAPFGAYYGMYLQGSFLKGKIEDKLTDYAYQYEDEHAKLGIDPKYRYYSLGFEFGYNNILKDRLVFSYSCHFNIPFLNGKLTSFFDDTNYLYSTDDYVADNQNEYKQNAYERMVRHNVFGLKIGIGLLLF